MNDIYFLIPKADMCWTMLNLSCCMGKEENLVAFKEYYIVETCCPDHEVFLPYPRHTANEIRELMARDEPGWLAEIASWLGF